MRWFRGHGRFSGWVALVAIALQLVLAFGHVHNDVFHHATEIAALKAAVADRGEPSNPAVPSHHDYCSIYAFLSLLSGAQGAAPPAVPAPVAIIADSLIAELPTVHTAGIRPAFQSRGPPLS